MRNHAMIEQGRYAVRYPGTTKQRLPLTSSEPRAVPTMHRKSLLKTFSPSRWLRPSLRNLTDGFVAAARTKSGRRLE